MLFAFTVLLPAMIVYMIGGHLSESEEDLEKMVKKTSKKIQSSAKKVEKKALKAVKKLSKRQEDIYNVIQDLKETGMKPIEDAFKNISTRTLRRDLNELVKKGHIKRSGSTKNTKYKVS